MRRHIITGDHNNRTGDYCDHDIATGNDYYANANYDYFPDIHYSGYNYHTVGYPDSNCYHNNHCYANDNDNDNYCSGIHNSDSGYNYHASDYHNSNCYHNNHYCTNVNYDIATGFF